MKRAMLKQVETGNKYGNMNTAKAFYPEDWTLEQRKEEFMKHRIAAAKDYGFDPKMMFMADQDKKDGSYKILDQEFISQYDDGWNASIPEDILIITNKTPNVVIGHPVADCPVVMMTDATKGVVAIGHCSAELIDKKMPMMIADALVDAYGSKDEDIYTFVSACAGPNWTYNQYPAWATDRKMWEAGITADENNIFHIDIKKVIANQLKERNIYGKANVIFSLADTIRDPRFYSNSASSPYGLNDATKAGRNFAGMFYKEEEIPSENKLYYYK